MNPIAVIILLLSVVASPITSKKNTGPLTTLSSATEKPPAQDVTPEVEEPPAPALPIEYELSDVRTLPQDISVYSSLITGNAITPACRENLTARFRKNYFSPWNSGAPLFDPAEMVRDMNSELNKEWYGENRRQIPRATLDALRDNCDLGNLPSLNRRGITVVATNMRILPTTRPFLKQNDGFPFDMMQQSGVKLNEPLRVLHISRDGLWLFAETAYASGWIDARDVAFPMKPPANGGGMRIKSLLLRILLL